MSLKYRPEIDGLRAIAVGSVLVYHAKVTAGDAKVLPGGFLGVDVFFVISGFLITSLIAQEWRRTSTFSLGDFYERRARRLLPALFAVIAVALVVAWNILLPRQMVDLGESLVASTFFVSNLYWDTTLQAYDAQSGLRQPFLHTWSLAVEEQFYILFPLLYVALIRRLPAKRVLAILAAVLVAGLVLAEVVTRVAQSFSFYGLQSRIWELSAGAMLAHVSVHRPDWAHGFPGRRWLPSLGLILVLVPMQAMRLEWHHPGLGTLCTIAGTVLIIGFASPGEPTTRLLSSRPLVGVGLISYSLYLWHYPIYAFGRHLDDAPSWRAKALWIGLSGALSVASYRWVEAPFRKRDVVSRKAVVAGAVAGAIAVCAFAATMNATNGLPRRMTHLIEIYGKNEFDNQFLALASLEPLAKLAEARGYPHSEAHETSKHEAEVLWFDLKKPGKRLLLVGNSHSKDMFNALHLNAAQSDGLQVARFGMHASLRVPQIDALLASPNFAAADAVGLTFLYSAKALPKLPALLQRIRERGKQVLLFQCSYEFEQVEGLPIFDWYIRSRGGLVRPDDLNRMAWERRAGDRCESLNARLSKIAEQTGARVIDRNAWLCNEAEKSCDLVTPDGYKAFYDGHHYTIAGARHFGKRMQPLQWLAP
jgi:peptidoglycan/LPS O-acetylase OafA/YrhL